MSNMPSASLENHRHPARCASAPLSTQLTLSALPGAVIEESPRSSHSSSRHVKARGNSLNHSRIHLSQRRVCRKRCDICSASRLATLRSVQCGVFRRGSSPVLNDRVTVFKAFVTYLCFYQCAYRTNRSRCDGEAPQGDGSPMSNSNQRNTLQSKLQRARICGQYFVPLSINRPVTFLWTCTYANRRVLTESLNRRVSSQLSRTCCSPTR